MGNAQTAPVTGAPVCRSKRMSIASLLNSAAVLAALILSLFAAPRAAAQLYTGSISGSVTDPSGAMIPSAHVNATDQNKGFSFTAMTDPSGRYLLRPIPPGMYTVSVEAPNFQSQRKEGIKVDVNQSVNLDFAVKVGAQAQVVDVQAGGVELQTQDAVGGQVVDRRLINDLPLINRSVLDLAFLAPGIAVPDHQCEGCTGTNFISNGSRNSTADILMDGVSTSNFEQNSGVLSQAYVPSVDAVEEFKVQQSNFSAEYGFSGATVVNLVTRSGTNSFHGTVYEFLRNDKLDANDWFSNHNGEERAPLRRNNFGFTIGGPIRKNKTFFFFDYDGTRSRGFSSASYGVATDAEKQGDFGELCTSRGASFDANGLCSDPSGQIWDPFKGASFDSVNGVPTRTIFVKNNNLAAGALSDGTTDANLIDPVAQKLMNLFPEPTKSDDLLNNFFRSGTDKQSNNQFDFKIDHRFSDRNLLSAKYSQLWGKFHSFNAFGNVADNFSSGPRDDTAHLFALNETYSFGPNLVLSVAYGYTRGAEVNHGILGDFPDLDPVALLGMPSYMNVSGFKQLPNVILDNYQSSGDANIGTQTFSYWRQGSDSHHLTGTLSWIRGSHEFKFGGEGRLHRMNWGQPGYPGGQFEFDNSGTSGPDPSTGGDSMASFLMGVGPATGCQNGACQYEVPNFVSTQNFQFGAFVQDNYRVTPKLTLNLGLRYDVSLPRTERFNRQNSLNLTAVNPINGGSVTYTDPITGQDVTRALLGAEVFANPKSRYNYGVDWKDIQPRFGFAYQMPHSLVVRGGYGIFYSTPRSGAAGTGPVQTYKGFDQFTNWISVDPTDQFTPVGRFSNPFPNGGPLLPPGNTLGALNDVGFDGGGAIKSFSNTPYEQSWSFGFEKELPWKAILEMSYVGKKGTHLYYSGAGEVNHLGPFIDKLTPAQRGALNNPDLANPFFGVITDPNSSLSGATIPEFQVLRPFPQFKSLTGDSPPLASSIYHALQVRAEKSYSNGLQFLVTYTWSKSIDDASSTDDSVTWLGGTTSLQDPNRLDLERSVSTWDTPHIFQFSYVYSLPFGRGKKFGGGMNRVADGILGGWQVNGTYRYASGRPMHITLSGGQEIPTYSSGQRRPNLNGILRRNTGPDFVDNYFANAQDVLSMPDDFTSGSAPRTITSARTPAINNTTMSLFKQFNIREKMRLEFRAEAFNAFNHPQFCGPNDGNTSVEFDSSGQIDNTPNFAAITNACVNAREVQLGLKLTF
jgi:hypothetical protein